MKERSIKVFKDNVHGYIRVPIDYTERFIDTELFQRLRYIEQTGMRILYPSARHDRFIHSLGTFYLGAKAFQCFKHNVLLSYEKEKNNHYNVVSNKEDNDKFWDRCQVLFEIACLLHDCAHTPFSHSLEYIYDIEPIEGISLKDKLKTYLGSKEFREDFIGQGAPHERMSALLVCSEYEEDINKILESYELNGSFDNSSAVEFIARMIIGCQYTTNTSQNRIKNCLISLLNSDSIDVDSLDYIIRDAKMSGIDNMSIDVDRLLYSLTLVEETIINNGHFHGQEITGNMLSGKLVAFSRDSISKINGKLNGTLQAKENVKFTVSGSIALSGNLQITKSSVIIPGNIDKVIIISGTRMKDLEEMEEHSKVSIQGIVVKDITADGTEVQFDENTNATFDLEAEEINIGASVIHATISGIFSGKLLGDYSYLPNSTVKCVLGFHKSSLSVIQNVVIARNYEYQWVYSHHKVVYYANYLLIELLRESLRYIIGQKDNNDDNSDIAESIKVSDILPKILSWHTMMKKSPQEPTCGSTVIKGLYFWRPCDSDIQAIFKLCYINAPDESKVKNLLEQYYYRRYRKSLWKSYAEMCNFFTEFTRGQVEDIFNLIRANSIDISNDKYGYLNDKWQKIFSTFGLNDVVWINGDSKLKTLDLNKTFIKFKDKDMTYASVGSPYSIIPIRQFNLFFLYYTATPSNEINTKELIAFFHEQLKNQNQQNK